MSELVIAPEHRENFVQFCRDWHGDHDKDWVKQFNADLSDNMEEDYEECAVYAALESYTGTDRSFNELVEAFLDTDGDTDAWEEYLKEHVK